MKKEKDEKIIKILILLFFIFFILNFLFEKEIDPIKKNNLNDISKKDINKKIKFETEINNIYTTKNNHTIINFNNINTTGIIFNNKIDLIKNKKYTFYVKISTYNNKVNLIIYKIKSKYI
jgi:cell division protein YceG involved in septum cleavage